MTARWSPLNSQAPAGYWSDESGLAAPDGELGTRVEGLRRAAAEACPGRCAELISARVAQLLGTADVDELEQARAIRNWHGDASFDEAERTLLEIVEQFIIDVHGVSDEQFERLRLHHSDKELMALLYHLALEDGFTKLHATMTEPGE